MGNITGGRDDPEMEGDHSVKVAATCFMTVAGVKCYHTSVIVDSHEYWFDSLGIEMGPALWSHLVGKARRKDSELETEVLDYGTTSMSGMQMLEALRPHFPKDHYDLLYKNCNHFTDCALYFLTRMRSPGNVNRAESIMTSTDPFSVNLMNKIARALIERRTGEPCEVDVYVRNPNTEDFTVEDVIGAIQAQDEEEEEDDSDDDDDERYLGCSSKIQAPPCCSRDPMSRPIATR
jgi:hypothetical protein